MCQMLVEGMEAGGCGFSAQILGDVGNVQLDFDGTPMVTDMMTEREVIAFSRALGRWAGASTQLTGPLRLRRSWPARAAGRSSGTRSSPTAPSTSTAAMQVPPP